MPAIKYLKTKVDNDSAWDATKFEAVLSGTSDTEVLTQAFAWADPQGNAVSSNSYKFLHHAINDDGSVGPASIMACQEAIEHLNTHGKDDGLSDEDMHAIRAHLAAHLQDAGQDAPQLNGVSTEGKHSETFSLVENSFDDDGEGTLTFPQGQVLMDGNQLRSGYSYAMDEMTLDEFNGTVTMDHYHAILAVVAKTSVFKVGNAVVMNKLQFAVKENPAAQIAYDLYRNGYAKDFSIETYGPWPSQDNTFHDARMSGLSCVVVGNSKSATMNELITNSIQTARKNGLDTSEVEKKLNVHVEDQDLSGGAQQQTINKDNDMKFVTQKNSRDFAVKLSYKNAAGDTVETELAPNATLDVSEDQAEAIQKQINEAKNPADDQSAIQTAVNEALAKQQQDFDAKLKTLEDKVIDNSATEPSWQPGTHRAANHSGKVEDMAWKERTALQIQALNAGIRHHDYKAFERLNEINRIHLEALQKEGIVDNSLDLPDLGNFVIPPEMIKEIKQQLSNYQPLLTAFGFQETLSLQTTFLKGNGEIQMSDVNMNDNGDNTDLKPIKKPGFTTDNVELTEFAAVTPVKSSAIRFAAVDVVQQLTKLYRTAYDRALATSIILRLQQAVNGNGNVVPFDYHTNNVDGLITMLTSWGKVAEFTPGGYFLMTLNTQIFLTGLALKSGPNGPLANMFTQGPDGIPLFWSRPYTIVPSTLMPNINTADTRSLTAEGDSVTVNSGIFYADPNDFIGKVSGGLNFQVSDVASYEENNTVKSAFQRDELVFRGYGYRASGLYMPQNVAAVSAPGVS